MGPVALTDRMRVYAARLAASHGVRLEARQPSTFNPFGWDGSTLATLDPSGRPLDPGWIIHDVSHHRVAAKHRRGVPNYDLGPGANDGPGSGPYWEERRARRKELGARAQGRDERAATLVDMGCLVRFGIAEAIEWWADPWENWCPRIVDGRRSWVAFHDNGIDKLAEAVETVRARVFLREDERAGLAVFFGRMLLDDGIRRRLARRLGLEVARVDRG